MWQLAGCVSTWHRPIKFTARFFLRAMQLCILAPHAEVAAALAFATEPRVGVDYDELSAMERADAIISLANNDGGIEPFYIPRFGWDLERRLRQVVQRTHRGRTPVGQALAIRTGCTEIPWLIYAPTLDVAVPRQERYAARSAFEAALGLARALMFETLVCSGCPVWPEHMPPAEAARQMRQAWDVVMAGAR